MHLLKKNIFITDDFKNDNNFIRLIGLEPITFGTEIQSSIQLSYKRKFLNINDTTRNNFKGS